MAPTCIVENRSVRYAKDAICATMAGLCRKQVGCNGRALILTGSLARDEGSTQVKNGRVRVLGGAGFFLFVNRPKHQLSGADADLLAKRAEEILLQQRIAVPPGDMNRMAEAICRLLGDEGLRRKFRRCRTHTCAPILQSGKVY